MIFTLYGSNVTGNKNNCLYPNKVIIKSEDDLKKAVRHDYVCARYKNNYRSNDNFISSDCLALDFDNDHTDTPGEWVYPDEIAAALPGVSFAIHYSRHHMRERDGRAARPKFHVLFPIDEVTDSKDYSAMKKYLNSIYPYFDTAALDSARFFFGTSDPQVEFFNGPVNLTEFLSRIEFDSDLSPGSYGDDVKIPEGSRNSTMSRHAGRILKRFGDTQKAYEYFLVFSKKCDPPLEDEELASIWKSALRFYKKVSAQDDYISPEEYNRPPGWEIPIPFDRYDLPPFPVDTLPDAISSYVCALAESTQTPVDMAATCAIAVISVCMQGKFKIRAKADWTEPVNTFILDVMNPSERKSAVENAMIRPLNIYEAQQNRDNAPLIESSRMQHKILEKRQRAIEEQAAKGKATDEDILRIAEEIASFREVRPLKLYVDDITTEKLTSVLAENDGRAAILSTEGGIFDTLAGTYSKTVNIDVMLKGYSGDPIRVDRIGRNSESIMNPALTVLLMVQPSVLSGLMQNGTFRGRGLTARFLYCIPSSSVGSRRYRSCSVPEDIYAEYEKRMINLLEDDPEDGLEVITLTPEADLMIEAFAEELEPKLKGEYADIADWAGKLVGNVLRISALLCRSRQVRCYDFLHKNTPLCVTGEDMENAISIGRYFIEHAKAAFMMMGIDPVIEQGKKVMEAITGSGLSEFTRRDIMRLCQSFKKADDVQTVLNLLTDYGYIAPKQAEEKPSKGRPPAQIYLVNPYVYQ